MNKSRNLNSSAKLAPYEQRIQVELDVGDSNSELKPTLLWQDLSALSKTSQFLLCCLGVFIFYILYGFLLELIFTLEGLKSYSWFVTLMQFGYYSLFGWAENILSKGKERRIPIKTYLLLAGLTLGTVGFSNTSLQHLNYPTQVIFKCCKLIPVMIGGILIQKKAYGLMDFLAATSMCVGLAWFTLADSYTSPNFNPLGVIMVSLALMCDAVIGNVQEKAMKNFNASNSEVVLYSYSFGFLYLLIFLVSTGKFFNAFYFCLNVRLVSYLISVFGLYLQSHYKVSVLILAYLPRKNPVQTYGYGLLFSASGYLGVQIVLTLVKTCGALAAATVTTCRKAVSIFLSFIFFSKPFTMGYFWSGLMVLLGIYLNIYAKNNRNVSFKDLVSKCLLRSRVRMRKKFSGIYVTV